MSFGAWLTVLMFLKSMKTSLFLVIKISAKKLTIVAKENAIYEECNFHSQEVFHRLYNYVGRLNDGTDLRFVLKSQVKD